MSTSRRESIRDNIISTLQGITTGNGYNNTITNVRGWKQLGNSLKVIPCAIVSLGRETKDPDPHPQATCNLPVFIDLWTRQGETDTTDTDELLNSLLLDIEKAIMADETRGGYAENTIIRSIMPFESVEGQPHCGLIIELEIIYQHKLTDPALYT
ncbi:MAG: hypothetical protein PHC54_05470 [Candidatus Omnitrophica bacterium]|nr:hypothetical protein [Candidatus Omnitrophota bacterium]MDD5592650.1 hypothetical protein [Candidatus Omnitrophota bacterium]